MQDNVNGTDLTPELFRATAGRGYRYFLLGADRESIPRAAEHARKTFTGWAQAGFHHGYVNDAGRESEVISQINRARPHLLLVAMGNPLQERWIHDHRHQLEVPLGMAVGGLFSYWAGNIRRSPSWLRRCGLEWLGILLQQPHKARRYLIGNPKFLLQAAGDAWLRRRHRKNRPPAKTSP
jgi:N-acetylglucosaminyldiphosphoundecaprenol N-acetyl-beta-D-mannosaminyltransferase